MSTNLSKMADLCEQADGPSRELDAAIFDGLKLVNEDHCRSWCRMDRGTDLTREMFVAAWAPQFTASVDAAMSLVPQGDWALSVANGEKSLATLPAGYGLDDAVHGYAATPALALTAAALRAHQEKP